MRWTSPAAGALLRAPVLGLISGCGAGKAEAVLPTLAITCAGVGLTVEVVDDPELRAHGLMGRTELESDAGMIFVYPAEAPRTFWMKDTPLPLSIAFLDGHGRIVNIADMVPLETTPVPSRRPAMFAIETAQGWFQRHAVAVGDKCEGLPGASSR